MGDVHAALSDYDAAMKELETQRKTIRDAAQRLTFLDRAAKIVEETIELHGGEHHHHHRSFRRTVAEYERRP